MDKKTYEQKRKECKKEYGFDFKYLKFYIILIFLVFVIITSIVKKPSEYTVALIALFFFILIGTTYPTLCYLTRKRILK